ncbi:unnamed protein product [Larinioides sclopetarius]|uniref:Regulatory protein zeste n=1 Tax=Larinioides sclopetarius TaxID=280406 RepID=A0AAV1Z1F8_9ARAC
MSDLLPRGFRFSHKDKSLLAKLVGSFPAILYKGLDAESLSKKMKAWEELTKQFNAKNNGHDFTFTPRHLKALWKRMKVQSKKAAAAQAAEGTNGSPLPDLSISSIESVMPIILSKAEKIPPDESSSSYVLPNDPPSPGSYVFPDNPPSMLDDVYSMKAENNTEDPYSPTPSPMPPTSHILSRCLLNGDKMKRRKPIEIEIENLQEEHRLRMECLRLDREIKILKKWKLEQEILSTGYELPPENYS